MADPAVAEREDPDAREHPEARRARLRNEREARRRAVSGALLAGRRYREIAGQLGVALSTIGSDVAAIREEWKARAAEDYNVVQAQEVAKLDRVESVLLGRVLGADYTDETVRAWLRLSARRASLQGLDAPKRHEVTGPQGGPVPVEQRKPHAYELVDELARRRAAHEESDEPAETGTDG